MYGPCNNDRLFSCPQPASGKYYCVSTVARPAQSRCKAAPHASLHDSMFSLPDQLRTTLPLLSCLSIESWQASLSHNGVIFMNITEPSIPERWKPSHQCTRPSSILCATYFPICLPVNKLVTGDLHVPSRVPARLQCIVT